MFTMDDINTQSENWRILAKYSISILRKFCRYYKSVTQLTTKYYYWKIERNVLLPSIFY
jgi:hypothetical protein